MKYLDLEIYHVYNRGARRGRIFFSDEHYRFCLRLIGKYKEKYAINVVCVCLMPNHYHIAVQQRPGGSISRFLQTTFNTYTQSINAELHQGGRLFQGGAKAIAVTMDAQSVRLFRYIHLNPVAARLVQEPEEWEFSDYRAWVGEGSEHSFTDLTVRRQYFESGGQYRDFVEELDDIVRERTMLASYLFDVLEEPFEGRSSVSKATVDAGGPSKGSSLSGGRYLDLIEKEFSDAQIARRQGNEGRARVCARRGAGFAVAWLCKSKGQDVRENDSLKLLKSVQNDQLLALEVREASARLTARITADFKYPFPTDPLDDARIIVDHIKGLVG